MFRAAPLCLLVLSSSAFAQAKPGDAMIEKYLAQETAKISQRFMDGAKTLEEWQARRPRLKQEYFEMLGLWPLPEKTPMHVTVTGTLERDNFMVEKLHFQSRPGLYVTGNLYRPKNVEGKLLPAVLYVCGHSGRGRDGNKTAFQDHGMWFATNGYVCLVIDTLQLGEIPGIHHGTYREGRWWWQARGYTPAGVECWNGIRAIDYLVSRPDVDAEKIAVTGISGGGASTIWIAAADERVKCAVPVSGMSDLESYVTNKIINGHCDCMLMINTYQWEWTTIAALIAPRPMLFCNSDNDRIFPMDGNRRIIERLRKCYAMHGKPELVDDYISKGGHDYRPDLRIAVFKWINKRVKDETAPVKDADFKAIPGKELRVFKEDKDIPKDAINGMIDETFVKRAEVNLPERGKFKEWSKNLEEAIQKISFRSTNPGIPCVMSWTIEPIPETSSYRINSSHMRAFGRLYDHTPVGHEKNALATLLILNAENDPAVIPEWAKLYLADGPIYLLAVRGVGPLSWTRKSPPNYVERSLALLGETVDEGRVLDIIQTMEAIANKPLNDRSVTQHRWRLVGRGQAAVLAAYAGINDWASGAGVHETEVVVVDPPVSHRDGPIFLNILRVLDVPDALGLLAPKKLTLINAKDKEFDRTVEIYRIAGAENKIMRK